MWEEDEQAPVAGDSGVALATLPRRSVAGDFVSSHPPVTVHSAATSTDENALLAVAPTPGQSPSTRSAQLARVRALNGWILPVVINGVATGALIDSGASTSVLSKSVYRAMPNSARSAVRADHEIIRGVGDSVMTPLGRMRVELEIKGVIYPLEMVVSSGDETAGCYLGMDFFDAYGADCSLRDGVFTIGDTSMRLRKERLQDQCARVRVDTPVTIPARSEMHVSCVTDAKAKNFGTPLAAVEPWDAYGRLAQDHLYVGACLARPSVSTVS